MDAKKIIDAQKQKQQAAEMLANMQQGATVAKTLGEAGLGGTSTVNQNRTTQSVAPSGNV
jgi:preprotein translocase subunit YajC